MQIFVRTLSGKTRTLELNEPAGSVQQVKSLLVDLEGVPLEQQRLWRGGHLLQEGDLLSPESMLELTVPLVGGACVEVDLKSLEDDFLTKNPTVSYFLSSYAHHPAYAKESIELCVNGQPGFHQSFTIPLCKRGDLLGRVYLVWLFPAIRHRSETVRRLKHKRGLHSDYADYDVSVEDQKAQKGHRRAGAVRKHHRDPSSSSSTTTGRSSISDVSPTFPSSSYKSTSRESSSSSQTSNTGGLPVNFVYWVNCISYWIVETTGFQLDGQDAVTHAGEWMELRDEYMQPRGKRTDEMVGRFHSEKALWRASRKSQIRYTPLRFFFCEYLNKMLPIPKIRDANPSIRVKTRDVHDCYFSSDGSVPMLMHSEHELSRKDLKLKVFANVYYLTEFERNQFLHKNQEYLITQVQYNGGFPISAKYSRNNIPVVIKVPFQHPVREIIWTIQRRRHVRNKDFFNYSGINHDDPLRAMKITSGGKDICSMREGKWFRLIEAHEHHTNQPRRHQYSKSWAAEPENTGATSGTKEFTTSDCTLHMLLQPGLGQCMCKIWGENENLFLVRSTPDGIKTTLGWR